MRCGGQSTWNVICTEHRTGTASSGTLRTGGRSIRSSFIEESRAVDSIILLDSPRNIRVRIPIGGGQVFFRQGPATTWTPLVNTSVDRVEPTFIQKQRAILRQDCEQARQMLNRVNRRLDEAVIMPTSVVDDMHRKVRNIFHINLDATPPDIFLGDGTRAFVIEEGSMEMWDLIASVKIGMPIELPNERIDAAHLSADEQHLIAVDAIGHVYSWDLGTALRLHGRALVNAVCQAVIPGKLSKLSATELTAAPFLDPQHDSDACGR